MKLVIFDLDGTLIDSAEDIANSVNEVRAQLALAPLPIPVIESYIGNGVRVLLERALDGCDPDVLERGNDAYLPIYRRRLLDKTKPYPGVSSALERLAAPGRTLAVLTNKPVLESVMILEGLNLDRHFASVYGGDSFPRKKPDPTGVYRLIEQAGAQPSETLFVGDSSVDLETARNAGVACCLVTYGIRPEHIAELEPDYRIHDLGELTAIVEANRKSSASGGSVV